MDDQEMGDGQMVEWAAKFLKQPPKQPFFLAAGIYRPHLPWYTPRRYFDMYPTNCITPPPLKADDLADLPAAGREMAAYRAADLEMVRQAGQYERILQAYLANITFCDALVGRLLDALDTSPAARNTIIVFWSDNGYHFGEKEHLHKFTLWERSTRLPFMVVAPGVTREQSRTERPVSFVDLFPTLNDLCGLLPVAGLDGVSLVPLLKDPQRKWDFNPRSPRTVWAITPCATSAGATSATPTAARNFTITRTIRTNGPTSRASRSSPP